MARKWEVIPSQLKVLAEAFKDAENTSNEKITLALLKDQTTQTYRISLLGYIHMGFDNLYGYTGSYEKQMTSAM